MAWRVCMVLLLLRELTLASHQLTVTLSVMKRVFLLKAGFVSIGRAALTCPGHAAVVQVLL